MKIETSAELTNQISTNKSKSKRLVFRFSSFIDELNISASNYPTISIYLPSRRCGRLLYSLMGENFIWEVSSSSIQIDDYLPTSLSPVSPKTLHDYLKHHTSLGRRLCRITRRIQVSNETELFTDDDQGEFLIEEILQDGIFNFVLMGDGRLIFTRIPSTRRKYNYRMLGKHAILAQHSTDVRFAGEIRIIDHHRTVLINNNSGTYQPTSEMISGAALYLHDLFPHLNVIGCERLH